MNSKYKHTIGIETTNPKNMPTDHAEIPVWNSENWFYEDVIIGHKIRSIRRTISEGEAMQFNCMVLDMHPYVGDEMFAKEEGMFNKRLVAGAMVFSYGCQILDTFLDFCAGPKKCHWERPILTCQGKPSPPWR